MTPQKLGYMLMLLRLPKRCCSFVRVHCRIKLNRLTAWLCLL